MNKQVPLLFLNVIIIATCGLIYELLAATVSSYVLGDSVTQFSLVIGIYLSAMGVGSWLSGYLDKNLAKRFVEIELAVAVAGGSRPGRDARGLPARLTARRVADEQRRTSLDVRRVLHRRGRRDLLPVRGRERGHAAADGADVAHGGVLPRRQRRDQHFSNLRRRIDFVSDFGIFYREL